MKKIEKSTSEYFAVAALLLCIWSSFIHAAPPESYPVPPETEQLLFYLQRSANSNTIIYDANLQTDGKLNSKQPVKVYWLRYNTTGERRKLNFAERNFAYGLNFEPTEKPGVYLVNLMAYSERDITVFVGADGNVEAHTIINGQAARLKRIYIDVSGSGFWSSVNSIELTGVALHNGKEITERFDPNEERSGF